jgi:cell wall-associated NlpC family hydrolase
MVPLRREPSDRAEMVTAAVLGQRLRLLERRGAWLRVAAPDGYLGWADGPQVWLPGGADGDWFETPCYQVRRVVAPVRTAPRRTASVLQFAAAGSLLPKVRRRSGWVNVRIPMLGTGWIEDIDEFTCPGRTLRRTLVHTAERFLGVPYLWGGVSGCGIDCSGLVQTVYGLHGIALPRDTTDQVMMGNSVGTDPRRWQAGDLVFFGRSRVTHVGICTGRGRVIHARGFVRRAGLQKDDPLFDEQLAIRLWDARSVIPARSKG